MELKKFMDELKQLYDEIASLKAEVSDLKKENQMLRSQQETIHLEPHLIEMCKNEYKRSEKITKDRIAQAFDKVIDLILDEKETIIKSMFMSNGRCIKGGGVATGYVWDLYPNIVTGNDSYEPLQDLYDRLQKIEERSKK